MLDHFLQAINIRSPTSDRCPIAYKRSAPSRLQVPGRQGIADNKSHHIFQKVDAYVRSPFVSDRHWSPIIDWCPIASKRSTPIAYKRLVPDHLQVPDRQGIGDDKSRHPCQKVAAYVRSIFTSDWHRSSASNRHQLPTSGQRLITYKRPIDRE